VPPLRFAPTLSTTHVLRADAACYAVDPDCYASASTLAPYDGSSLVNAQYGDALSRLESTGNDLAQRRRLAMTWLTGAGEPSDGARKQ